MCVTGKAKHQRASVIFPPLISQQQQLAKQCGVNWPCVCVCVRLYHAAFHTPEDNHNPFLMLSCLHVCFGLVQRILHVIQRS